MKGLLMRKLKPEIESFPLLSFSLFLSLQVFILPGAPNFWFSCCLWKAACLVSKVKCLHICRVPSVQNVLEAWDSSSGYLCLQLREMREEMREVRCCHTKLRKKRWLSCRRQRGRAKRGFQWNQGEIY
jgi:hypothetical protein